MNMIFTLFFLLPLIFGFAGICGANEVTSTNKGEQPEFLYKVITPKQWKESEGAENIKLTPEDKEFIHLATSEQLSRIIPKYFGKFSSVWILKLDVKKLPGDLVLEVNPGGKTAYYHLYHGSILRSAVVELKGVGCAF